MAKTETQAKTPDQISSRPTADRQSNNPDKEFGPGRTTTAMASLQSLPAGHPPGSGAGRRARLMTAGQQALGNQRISRLVGRPLQAKLTVGPANDPYEQEADQVADTVMRVPQPSATGARVSRQPESAGGAGLCPECKKRLQQQAKAEKAGGSGPASLQRAISTVQLCPNCARKLRRQVDDEMPDSSTAGQSSPTSSAETIQRRPEEEEPEKATDTTEQSSPAATTDTIQRQPEEERPDAATADEDTASTEGGADSSIYRQTEGGSESGSNDQTPEVSSETESYLNSSSGSGQPLSESSRAFMEPRFGQDFSGVRVHNDSRAAGAAKGLNAQAFTRGQDIYFGEGRYQPGTPEGQRLVGHELTHVVQQGGSIDQNVQRFNGSPSSDEATQQEDQQSFIGEKANISAEVEPPLGIILHTTPSPDDRDYHRKRNEANKQDYIYPKGTKVTIVALGDAQHAGWVKIRTKKGEAGWVESRFLKADIAAQPGNSQAFVGERTNISAEIKPSLGIIPHATPTPDDADYQRKRSAENKNDYIYPQGTIVTIIAFGNKQHIDWLQIRTPSGEVGWIEKRFLRPLSQQEEIEKTRAKSGGFMIKSTAGSTIPIGTLVTYSVDQTDSAPLTGGSSYHYTWSVENDPSTQAKVAKIWPKLPLTIQGPKDKTSWTLQALLPGIHLIKVKISQDDKNVANLVYTQRVSSAKEESKQELFLLKFLGSGNRGGDEFVLSLTATKSFNETQSMGKAELTARSSRALHWEKVYWDVRGREVEDPMDAISWGGRWVDAKPLSRKIAIPSWSWFSPKLLEHIPSSPIKVGPGTYQANNVEIYTFDLNDDLKSDFSIIVKYREDQINRHYSIITSDNRKFETYEVSFFQPDAWKHYRGPSTPRREEDDFLDFLASAIDIAVGFIPVIGDLVDLAEAITGRTKWGEKMSTTGRVVTSLSVVVPFVGGAALRKVGSKPAEEVAKLAAKIGKNEGDVLAVLKAVDKNVSASEAEQIARWRKRVDAGYELTEHELKELGQMLRKIDIEAKAAKASPAGTAAKNIEQETTETLVSSVGKRGIAKNLGEQVKEVIQNFVQSVKKWAEIVFQKFGFRRYIVEVEGQWVLLYGIRSKVLLARFRKDSLEEWIVDNSHTLEQGKEIGQLRHSRASQLGAAKAAKSSGDDALANLLRNKNATRISEEIGEVAADAVIKTKFPSATLYLRGHGSGTTDLIYRTSRGEFIVVEAKGGAGKLGTREVAPGVHAEQGTIAYLRDILKNMGPEGADVLDALDKGKVRYFLSETPIPSGTAPLETTLREFRRK